MTKLDVSHISWLAFSHIRNLQVYGDSYFSGVNESYSIRVDTANFLLSLSFGSGALLLGHQTTVEASIVSNTMARSGLQTDVIHLYRACLRAIRTKPENTHDNWYHFVRTNFDQHMKVKKKDFSTIEYHLRVGNRRLEQYAQPGITNIH